MSVCLRFLVVIGLGIGAVQILDPVANANVINESARQKEVAEGEREALKKKLGQLKSDIIQTEAAKSDVADTLKKSEVAIANANYKLHLLGQKELRMQSRLVDLVQQEKVLSKMIATQKTQIENFLREQYMAGDQSHIRLMLSGENSSTVNREMQYLGYISQSQSDLITKLRANLASVEANKYETQNAHKELDSITKEQRSEKAALEEKKVAHAQLLASLSSKLIQQHKQVDTLERNQKLLSALVEKLAEQIEAQKKEQAIMAKQRAERLTREKIERGPQDHRRSKKLGDSNKPSGPIGSDEVENERLPDVTHQEGIFASLRKHLHLPIKGTIISRYGSSQSLGPSNKGLFIKALEGGAVHAVASGRVVFSEKMHGFGNLIIIDHGSQYLSIYGNNKVLYKHLGDVVKSSDVIATVGSSGDGAHTGLYFELRHRGTPFDPMSWVNLK